MQKSKATTQISKYILTGILAFMAEYGSFLLLAYVFSVKLLAISQTLSFCLGLLVSFLGSRQFTFREADRSYKMSKQIQLAGYATLAIVNLLVSNLMIYSLVHQFMAPSWIAKVITMGAVALWNFIIFKKLIFKTTT